MSRTETFGLRLESRQVSTSCLLSSPVWPVTMPPGRCSSPRNTIHRSLDTEATRAMPRHPPIFGQRLESGQEQPVEADAQFARERRSPVMMSSAWGEANGFGYSGTRGFLAKLRCVCIQKVGA